MIIITPRPGSLWYRRLRAEFSKSYYIKLWSRICKDSAKHRVLPAFPHVFRALDEVDLDNVKVVILGQDPYPTAGKAIGRSFGVPKDYPKINSSLENILKEVESDTGAPVQDISFEAWAKQGVLMLNTRLTVIEGKPMSHSDIGWEPFMDEVMKLLNAVKRPGVVMLWGAEARKYADALDRWSILETSHPCKFSAHRGFIGCGHFKKANAILRKIGLPEIDWIGA